MPTREELHTLIDTMSDAAINAAHRLLTNMQTWPPTPPPTVEEMRKRMDDYLTRRQQEMKQRFGTVSGFGGHGNYDPAVRSVSNTRDQWDGDTFIAQTYRRHFGHELMVIERIRVDGQRLIYKHEIEGPGGKREEREITFDLA